LEMSGWARIKIEKIEEKPKEGMVHVNGNRKLCTPFTSGQREVEKEKEKRIYAQHLFLPFFSSFNSSIHQWPKTRVPPNKTIHSTIISPHNQQH